MPSPSPRTIQHSQPTYHRQGPSHLLRRRRQDYVSAFWISSNELSWGCGMEGGGHKWRSFPVSKRTAVTVIRKTSRYLFFLLSIAISLVVSPRRVDKQVDCRRLITSPLPSATWYNQIELIYPALVLFTAASCPGPAAVYIIARLDPVVCAVRLLILRALFVNPVAPLVAQANPPR
jgi:hypothetical protein